MAGYVPVMATVNVGKIGRETSDPVMRGLRDTTGAIELHMMPLVRGAAFNGEINARRGPDGSNRTVPVTKLEFASAAAKADAGMGHLDEVHGVYVRPKAKK